MAAAVGFVALLASVALAAAHPIYSIDFFWHLAIGEVIARTGEIPRTNLFSSAEPGRAYVQFNWLWDWLAAQVVARFGLRGVRVLQVVLLTSSFGVLYLHARRALSASAPAFALCALALVLFEDRFQERPAALVLGFVALLLPVLLGGYRTLRARDYGLLLLLSLLWANLHGGESLLLLGSAGALLAGELLTKLVLRDRPAFVRHAAGLVGCVLVALLTSPTALPGLLHWAQAIGPQVTTGNEEWQPSYTMLRNGARPAFVLIALAPTAVLLAYLCEQLRRVRRLGRAAVAPAEWLLCAGYLALAHQAVRNSFLCLLPLAFMLQREPSRLATRRLRGAFGLAGAALLCVALEDALPYSYGGFARVGPVLRRDLLPEAFPELAADFASEAGLAGGVINDGRWGGYLIWRLWPRNGVFADTRHHFTPEMWRVFLAAFDPPTRAPALARAHARWGIELAVFRAPTFPLLLPPSRWRLLYKAGAEEVHQHLDGAHAARNLERTRRYLAAHGLRVPSDPYAAELPALATRLGARQHFATAFMRARLSQLALRKHAPDAQVVFEAHLEHGELLYRAGLYDEALRELASAAARQRGDPRPSYYAAFCHFARGELERARAHVAALDGEPAALSPRQRLRLRLLRRALSPATLPRP